ncbi:hypothetical protein LguiA_003220 [Lonicera macranthoides]
MYAISRKLQESKGDLLGSEEYYLCATLADPKDSEILMQYAKLVWELHHDQDRARSCFNSAWDALRRLIAIRNDLPRRMLCNGGKKKKSKKKEDAVRRWEEEETVGKKKNKFVPEGVKF